MGKIFRKKRGCKWCKAPYESLITEEKNVKLYGTDKKLKKAPEGQKWVAKVVRCKECGEMVRFYGPKLVAK